MEQRPTRDKGDTPDRDRRADEVRDLEIQLEKILSAHGGDKGLEEVRDRARNGDDKAWAVNQSVVALRRRIFDLTCEASLAIEVASEETDFS